jgi:hypothetical protein
MMGHVVFVIVQRPFLFISYMTRTCETTHIQEGGKEIKGEREDKTREQLIKDKRESGKER